MKKNFTTERRLMQYGTAAAAFLMVGPVAGSVIYTDVDPDNTISGEGAEMVVDINADGSDDFSFMIYSFTGSITYYSFPVNYGVKVAVVNALGDNEFVGTMQTFSGYTVNYMPRLEEGAIIGSTEEFVAGFGTLALSVTVFGTPYYLYGNWGGAVMEYMGFRLVIDESNYYGWMRLSVTENGGSVTLHDYAYQSNNNQSINAGQTVAVANIQNIPGVELYSFGTDIFVKVPAETQNALNLQVFSLSGQLIKDFGALNNSGVFDCSDLPDGNYVAELTNGSGRVSSQVFIGR